MLAVHGIQDSNKRADDFDLAYASQLTWRQCNAMRPYPTSEFSYSDFFLWILDLAIMRSIGHLHEATALKALNHP